MNDVFAACELSGLLTGVVGVVIGVIAAVLIMVAYDWVRMALDEKRGYTKHKGAGGCTVYQMHNKR